MNAWQITKKDVKLLVRDRRTLFVLVALPLAFIAILGVSTGQLFNEREKARKVRLGVVNEDQSDLAGKLITEVNRLNALELHEFGKRQEGRESLSIGRVDVLVTIGATYHERVEQLDLGDIFYTEEGRLANRLDGLDIHVEAGAFLANAAEIVQELVFAFALRTIAPDVLKDREPGLATRLLTKARAARNARDDEPVEPAEVLQTEFQTRANIVYQILVPSYTVMFVFFIVNFMARSFISERDIGTLNRLRMAPVTRIGLMLGKTVPFLLISLIQTAILFLAGRFLFGMSWGNIPHWILPVMLCTSMSATALGLLVATVVKTDSQVSAYANTLVLIMAGISGCLMPRSWQPEIMQQVGLITPHAWALIAYDQLLNRDLPDLHVVTHCCLMLVAFSAGFMLIGWWRFRAMD
jgi:ABC-2 type transport system permease protein